MNDCALIDIAKLLFIKRYIFIIILMQFIIRFSDCRYLNKKRNNLHL